MEVHHHPHVEKKNFREYLLEFLMIFLAVTMGFFAESIREYFSDNAREREYVISMIEDAETDISGIKKAIELNKMRALQLDTLSWLCANYDPGKYLDAEMYRHFKPGVVHPAFISPTERTIQQLKNAGGMRLIRKKAAVDSIILYDDAAKKLADQQIYYELYQNKSIEIGSQLFNFNRIFGTSSNDPSLRNFRDKDPSVKLYSTDRDKLMQFSNLVGTYAGILQFYIVRLQEMNDHAVNMMKTLKTLYDIEAK